jgi:CBS domain-containing protein
MSVGSICTRSIDLADAEETIQAAAYRLRERRVGTLVILDRSNKPVGILTDRDLVTRAVAQGKDPCQTHVGEVMTRNLTTISEAAPIEQALSLMRSGSFRRLPVTASDGSIVGMVTLDDVLSLLAEEFADVGALLAKELPTGVRAIRPRRRLGE